MDGDAARQEMFEAGAVWPGRQGLRLSEATAGGPWLIAVCGCSAVARVDARPWLADGLGALRLPALEGRLRCLCGARQARLMPAPAGEAGGPGSPIHVFR